MKKRIVILIVVVLLAGMTVAVIASAASFGATFETSTVDSLKGDINAMELTPFPDGIQSFAEDYAKAYGQNIRVTFIDMDGNVVADSSEDPATFDNHSGRPEVIGAMSDGYGTDSRVSETTGINTLYVARDTGGGFILRLAVPVANTSSFVLSALPVIIISFIILTIVALIFSGLIARGVLAPVSRLHASVQDYLDGNPLSLETNGKYEEVGEISLAFSSVAERLNRYISRVKSESKKSSLILDNIKEGLMVLDKDQDVLLINKAARAILGASSDITNVNILHFIRRQDVLRRIDNAFLKRETTSFDVIDETNGKTYRYYLSFVPKGAFQQSGDGLLILISDVSDIVFSEKVRKDFSANVSHELKTPLTSINGYAELIHTGMARNMDEAKNFALRISAEADRLMGLINDTLALSELENITMDEQLDKVDLAETMRGVSELLAQKLEKRGISLEVTGNAQIIANKHRIEQMLLNLCDNAIKYGKEGGHVTVTLAKEDGRAVIKVADDGIGIPDDEKARVFERFYRAKNAGAATVPGTGLGLAIVKHTALLYDGEISVTSEAGEGSVFTVSLPHVDSL